MTNGPRPSFRVTTEPRVERQLARLNRNDYRAVRKRIDDLAVVPRPRKMLQLRNKEHRVRQGNWRIFYEIDDAERIVTITNVLRRNERTYRDL